jgi:hypothetical protein
MLRMGSQDRPWLPTKSFSFSNGLRYEPPGLLGVERLFIKVRESKGGCTKLLSKESLLL